MSNVEVFKKKLDRLNARKKEGVLRVPQRSKKTSISKPSRELTSANIKGMEELALTLKPIYRRMLNEGWIMKDGKLVKQNGS